MKIVEEHVGKRTITEYIHIPSHEERRETLTFKNAKHELEDVEHIGCFVCGSMRDRQSHHIVERSFAQKASLDKVAWLLFNHRDYHGHCRRDFKSAEDLAAFLKTFKTKDEALDSLYNQVILCRDHHVGEGHGIHYLSAPTFDALLVMEDGFEVALNKEEFERMKRELEEHHKANH